MDDLRQVLDDAVRFEPDIGAGLEGALERTRARERRRRGWTIAVAVVIFLIPATLLASSRFGTDRSDESAGSYVNDVPDLTGPALVDALGLEFTEGSGPEGCGWYVDVDGVGGYCLDGHVRSDAEAWEVWHRLAGHVPTVVDRRVNQIHEAMKTTEDPDELDALAEELAPLLAAQEREPSWGGPESWEALLDHEGFTQDGS
jgi:hypothetical protein